MKSDLEPEKNARSASLRLWGHLLFNIESFPQEKFDTLDRALKRAGSSLVVLRRETFTVYCFAFEFAILNVEEQGTPPKMVIRDHFIGEALEFVSQNEARWGTKEGFIARLDSYRNAISGYLRSVQLTGGGGNIIEPIKQVFWPCLMGDQVTERLLLSDAQTIRSVADQVLATFLPLFRLALGELKAGA